MKKYIVGIDFGHGETAAWVVPIAGVPQTNMKEEGESLRLSFTTTSDNDKLLDSVVYCSKEGIFSLERKDCSDIYTELKSPVSDLNRNFQKKAAYIAYIQLVVKRLLSANETLLKKEDGDWNFYLCIACPTKWGGKEKDDYIHFFNKALSEKGLSVLWVINESDAAFFTHRPKDNPNQCVLVVDYGSSTIDYTVIHNGKKVSDDSWSNAQLGASCMERAVRTAYKNSSDDEYQTAYSNTERILIDTGNSHMSVESRLLYDMRKRKEFCFINGQYPSYSIDFNFGTYTGLVGKQNPFKPYPFEFYGNLEDITKEYRTDVLADFEQLKTKIEKRLSSQKVERIVLSGGACNMKWVYRMLKSVFPEANIVEDRTPSYVVAKGIALYAQAQFIALQELRTEIGKINFEDIYKKADMESTAEAISQMSNKVKDAIRKLSYPDAGDIHVEFRKFLYCLDGSDERYCAIFRTEMNMRICDEVHEKLSRIVRSLFYKEIGRDEIDISLDIDVYFWPEEPFKVGGIFSNLIQKWIEQAAVACGIASEWGPNSFNWTKGRNPTECEQLANGTISRMVDYFKYNSNSINYNPTNMAITTKKINNLLLDLSERLFYKLQLFKTTFS